MTRRDSQGRRPGKCCAPRDVLRDRERGNFTQGGGWKLLPCGWSALGAMPGYCQTRHTPLQGQAACAGSAGARASKRMHAPGMAYLCNPLQASSIAKAFAAHALRMLRGAGGKSLRAWVCMWVASALCRARQFPQAPQLSCKAHRYSKGGLGACP